MSKGGPGAPGAWRAPFKKTHLGAASVVCSQSWANCSNDYLGTEAGVWDRGSIGSGGLGEALDPSQGGPGRGHPHQLAAQGPSWALREARAMQVAEARMRGGRPPGPLKPELDPAV